MQKGEWKKKAGPDKSKVLRKRLFQYRQQFIRRNHQFTQLALDHSCGAHHLRFSKLRSMQNRIHKFIFVIVLIAASFTVISFKARQLGDDLWSRIGLSQDKASSNIKESFLRGALYYYGASGIKKLAAGDRPAVAADLMAYAKQYLNSEAFITLYNKERMAAKPMEMEIKGPKTREEVQAERIAETEKSIKEMEANIKKMPAEAVKHVQPMIESFKANLAEYKKPDSEMIDMFYMAETMGHQGRLKEVRERKERWEREYPADYRQLIKARLQTFIDLAETVDFSAKTKPEGGKQVFVNPNYETQSPEWKQIFRSGAAVIKPAVAFAKAWIAEIEK